MRKVKYWEPTMEPLSFGRESGPASFFFRFRTGTRRRFPFEFSLGGQKECHWSTCVCWGRSVDYSSNPSTICQRWNSFLETQSNFPGTRSRGLRRCQVTDHCPGNCHNPRGWLDEGAWNGVCIKLFCSFVPPHFDDLLYSRQLFESVSASMKSVIALIALVALPSGEYPFTFPTVLLVPLSLLGLHAL